jgi:hypothetical protein
MKRIILAIFVSSLLCCAYSQVKPEYIAQAIKRTIDINAGLEQWEGLRQYPVILSNSVRPTPVTMQGYFSVAWDDESFYLLGVFEQPEDTVTATLATDAPEWWNEDTLEIFFRLTPESDSLHFAMSPNGTRFGAEISGTEYQSVGVIEENRWIVQLAFPLDKQLSAATPDTLWELKIARGNTQAQEFSVWPRGEGFLDETNFGYVYVTDVAQDPQTLAADLTTRGLVTAPDTAVTDTTAPDTTVGLCPDVPQVSAPEGEKLLILHQQPYDGGNTIEALLANADYINTLPFDGVSITSDLAWNMMKGEAISYDDFYSELSPLGAVLKLEHNFVIARIENPGDVFDDAAWAITVDNWRNLAKVSKELGFEGIFFDNEEYDKGWFNYPEDYDNPVNSLEDYTLQTQLRGQQMMEAAVAEFPTITVLFFHGPYVSVPDRPDFITLDQVANAGSYELLGPLFAGFLEGLGTEATLVDGGEVYQYRTDEEFQNSYLWRKYCMTSSDTESDFIPQALRASYPEQVSISYGLYNQTWPSPQDEMNPDIMKTTLENALRWADKYVWYYTEEDNWLEPGKMPQEWLEAVRGARQGE